MKENSKANNVTTVDFTKKKYIFLIIFFILLLVALKYYSILIPFTVEDNNFHQIEKIKKSVNPNNFCFAVFGDNKNSHKVFEDLINKINNDNKIEFAIDIGDLVYDGETEKYKFFLRQISKLKKPLLTAIGNHDIADDGRGNYYRIFGPFYYSFALGETFFIFLDDANEIKFEDSQTYWLRNQLSMGKNYKRIFIFFHVPLWDPRKNVPEPPLINIPIIKEYEYHHELVDRKQAKMLIKLFEEYKVTEIFTSHIHAYYRGYWGSVPFVITGGAGAELVGNNPKHDFYHYLKICITNNNYTEKIIKLPTPEFEIFDRLTHDLWLYIYSDIVFHYLDFLILLLSFLLMLIFFLKVKKTCRKD